MKVLPAVTLVTLGGLATISCNLNPNYAKNGDSPILLLITGINGGNPLDSDVVSGTPPATFICPDLVAVRVENKLKNPNLTTIDFRGDIVIERYEVHYFRSDGRGVEGVDVPYAVSGNLASEVISGAAVNVTIEVVRRQAKLEPPLLQLANPSGGSLIFTAVAEITLHARTTIGQAMTAKGRLQINFGDFVDTLTACPVPTTSG